ncbi:MAG TPA: hypothetical protein VHE55_18830 [Fimbriimonadaceae bacterium]|nr:hypothetical protein [Fimbriimonadaceae bacterium]
MNKPPSRRPRELRSKVFTITRPQLVRAASEQYLRRMWPVFVAFPIFGLLAMIFGPNQFVRAVGFFAFIWPFSIPARVVLASWGKAKRLMQPTWVLLEKGVLYFHDDKGSGMKLPLDQVRRVDLRGPYYVFETRNFNFALVPLDAFDENERAAFEKGVGLHE